MTAYHSVLKLESEEVYTAVKDVFFYELAEDS